MKIGSFVVPTWLPVLAGVFLLFLIVILSFFLWIMGSLNSENTLRNKLIQRNETVKTDYSAGFNILVNQNALADKERQYLKEVAIGVVEGRYKNDQSLLVKMVTEQNPNISNDIAKKFFNSLEVYFNQRAAGFKDLAELKRQHDTMLGNMPASIIYKLWNREKVSIVYVKDSGTTESFKTGIDDRQIVK